LPIGHGDPAYWYAACTLRLQNRSKLLNPERAEFTKLGAASDDLVLTNARRIPSMRNRPIGVFSVLCMLVATSPLTAQALSDQAVQRLEAAISQMMRDQKIPGFAIGIVKDNRLVYSRGFGVMRVGDPNPPVTTETLFHMASITKPFVATAIMQLVEQGKVSLDDPVIKHLPYFRLKDPRYKEITIRQMVTHTSGMPDVTNYYWDKPEYDDGALERYVRSLDDKTLRSAPGKEFRYSNMAFEVLGDLVAKLSGKSFEDYVEANILKPVGMKSSTLLYQKADPARLATGYTVREGAVVPVAHYPYNRAHTPSSNLHSNVEDMARWIRVNLNRGDLDGCRILKNSTYDVLWKPAAPLPGRNWHVGISWFLAESNGEEIVMHNGGDDGFATHLAFAPRLKAGVFMMANCDHISSIKAIWEAAMERPAPFAK
jgi:CubicO group peptidase (beta-lactamase class C family)